MENKRSNKGLIVLIIILILIVLGLGGYIVYDKFIKEDTCICTKCKTTEVKNKDTKVSKKNSSKEIVYDEGTNKYKKVPIINIDSTDADKFNKEINDFVGDENYDGYYTLKYDFYENNDILSVIVIKHSPGASVWYYTANINIKTGIKVTNKEIIKLKKIEEDLGKIVFETYEKIIESNNQIDEIKQNHIYGDEYTSIYDGNKNKLESTKLDDFILYLNKDGELCAIADVYVMAGPEHNNYIYNIDSVSVEKYE